MVSKKNNAELSPLKQRINRLIEEQETNWAQCSEAIGRNHAYFQQWINRASAKDLPEVERNLLAKFLDVPADSLKSEELKKSSLTDTDETAKPLPPKKKVNLSKPRTFIDQDILDSCEDYAMVLLKGWGIDDEYFPDILPAFAAELATISQFKRDTNIDPAEPSLTDVKAIQKRIEKVMEKVYR